MGARDDVQRLYEQAGEVAGTAYLLFAAAQPLARGRGSPVRPLLPLLNPGVLRSYASASGRCSSPLVASLYDIAGRMKVAAAGSGSTSCHAALLKELGTAFVWLRGNGSNGLPRAQGRPGEFGTPWPLPPGPSLETGLLDALATDGPLGNSAAAMQAACGLDAPAFASAVTRVSDALAGLLADLDTLEQVAEQHRRRWDPAQAAALASDQSTLGDAASALDGAMTPERRRLAFGDKFFKDYPSNFTVADPAGRPRLLIPLIFHILLYKNDDGTFGPAGYDSAPARMAEAVRVANLMSAPTNIQFFIKEVRYDPSEFPYLVRANRTDWLVCFMGKTCLWSAKYIAESIADFPRSINLYIVSDTTAPGSLLGYSFCPGSDVQPYNGFAFVTWDSFTADNRPETYYKGSVTLVHELHHFLGVDHNFGSLNFEGGSCRGVDDDYVDDTPITSGPVDYLSFREATMAFCLELFWGRDGGNFDVVFRRWSTALGIPEEDKNAWADSCPKHPGYDELGNYMTYNTDVCFSVLGHFTPGQAQRAHYVTAAANPLMYAWAQYYALGAAPPLPAPPAPIMDASDLCKVTTNKCPCKSNWTYYKRNYSYCGAANPYNNLLRCEVADPGSCHKCTGKKGACVLECAGTRQLCGLPSVPGSYNPNPPQPPSPPPFPPPRPPRQVPDECKVSEAGCPCRSMWLLPPHGLFSYCGSLETDRNSSNYGRLLCQVEPSCPDWKISGPFQTCSKDLSPGYCGKAWQGDGSDDVQRLYEQAGEVAGTAYLFFAAAQPLARGRGSPVRPLLPLLTPRVLRSYASAPACCSSPLVASLYDIAGRMKVAAAGSGSTSCYGVLLKELGIVFAWLQDNGSNGLPRAQGRPGEPRAPWPLPSGPSLETGLLAALAREGPLGMSAPAVQAACGLDAPAFASMMAHMSDALEGLLADLDTLQQVAEQHRRRWDPEQAAALASDQSTLGDAASALDGAMTPERRRLAFGGGYITDYPSNFTAAGPAGMPRLLIPLVFHILLYKNNDGTFGPAGYDSAPARMAEAVRLANLMSAPTNIQFYIKEVRNDPSKFPYLLRRNRADWLNCATTKTCLGNVDYLEESIADFPRSINLYIVSDNTLPGGLLGFSSFPGSDVWPSKSFVFITWDSFTADNRPETYYNGAVTLVHELYHFLGVGHNFGSLNFEGGSCRGVDDDYVDDTPITSGPVLDLSFEKAALAFCLDLFWGRDGGNFDVVFRRWSTSLGIPEEDKNAWADSCPKHPGYDELGNYMTYNADVCYSVLGHFTPGQAQRAHFITAAVNPLMYAWAQFYALGAAPPLPAPPAPIMDASDLCKVTTNKCACKASWTSNKRNYSYCAATRSNSNTLQCEVADPGSCHWCAGKKGACIQDCAGTRQLCGVPSVPGTYNPNPPQPPSPPPFPPPQPPRQVPDECKVSEAGCPCRPLWSQPEVALYSYCGYLETDPTYSDFNRLLLGAGSPLRLLLPLLTPSVLRSYASAPGRCSSPLVASLYDIAGRTKGSAASSDSMSCHAILLREVGPAFLWLRGNGGDERSEAQGHPERYRAPWPLRPGPLLESGLLAALATEGPLGDSAAAVQVACGLDAPAFASVMAHMSDALAGLLADLGTLQQIAEQHRRRWGPQDAGGEGRDGAPAAIVEDAASAAERIPHFGGRRRRLQFGNNYITQYPSNFTAEGPGGLPQLLIPLIFHVLLYRNADGTYGPAGYDIAPEELQELVRLANLMSKPTNIQFFIKEVRNDPSKFPYLLRRNRADWLRCYTARTCRGGYDLMIESAGDFPRSINIYVASDITSSDNILGSATSPGSDVYPDQSFVFLVWNTVHTDARPKTYYDGGVTLVHELFHFLGLGHTFGQSKIEGGDCTGETDDYVDDTPLTSGPVSDLSFAYTSIGFCLDLFWGRDGGDFTNVFRRWSTALGIPEEDKNAWADSCPRNAGYDELGNYMTYNVDVCYSVLGHFTPGQAQRAHYVTAAVNPLLYAWAQYYAQRSAPPPAAAARPPAPVLDGWDVCKVTRNGCACKASWQYQNRNMSYCANIYPDSTSV
ncbi:hypothetical protein GPECTOR_91g568 [Gonium pectorale]|uniref:Peptidase M43 pregnancy-associated plasma-A domain-containing protein n=1 Tax=Gonium pectorale TaxID=33097 RepID=A0A150G0P4_GONPE|nr:hypothetical protein GPECTOR_91g568 [Gonium pectorale]|eukprot:KXZ43414.1 hypothetical protein GPECTOR_91g568 [Gonium pectorale]